MSFMLGSHLDSDARFLLMGMQVAHCTAFAYSLNAGNGKERHE